MGDVLQEYEKVAAWLARRRLPGTEGDPLPDSISDAAESLIDHDVDTFMDHVRVAADLLAVEEQRRAIEFDSLVSSECAAVAEAEPLAAKTDGRAIAQPMPALPELFSPAEIGALGPDCEPAEPLVADSERAAKAA